MPGTSRSPALGRRREVLLRQEPASGMTSYGESATVGAGRTERPPSMAYAIEQRADPLPDRESWGSSFSAAKAGKG